MIPSELTDQPAERGAAIALGAIAVLALLSMAMAVGCRSPVVTINILSNHSRYGQVVEGTNNANTVKNEGGGGNGAHAALTP